MIQKYTRNELTKKRGFGKQCSKCKGKGAYAVPKNCACEGNCLCLWSEWCSVCGGRGVVDEVGKMTGTIVRNRERVVEYNKKGRVTKRYKLIHGQEPCEKHKKYQGKRQPRVACYQCWSIFFAGEREAWNF